MQNIFSKAYNTEWIENLHNQSVIKNWHFKKYISESQFNLAKAEFSIGFKHSNIFVTIGLFIFTNIIMFSAGGLVSLFLMEILKSRFGVSVLLIIYAIILYIILHNLIEKNKFYRSGVDNALIYAIVSLVFGSLFPIFDWNLPVWFFCIVLIFILSIALIKYADYLITVCLYGTWIVFWFNILSKIEVGKLLLPFVIMAISAISYFAIKYWRKIEKTNYYKDPMAILEILSLATFYLGGNYFIVREGNAELNHLSQSIQIVFAPLFYFFTIGIPLCYTFWALKKHDRKMLIVGLLAIAFSIFTYKNYFSIMPIEWALTLGGLALIIGAILAIRYFKETKLRLTYQPDSENKFQNMETLVVNQIIPTATEPEGTKFGGGDFGGAGAGGEY